MNNEKMEAMDAIGKKPAHAFRLLCEVVIEPNGDVNNHLVYDLNSKLAGTTWDRLGEKCFRACEKLVNEHFNSSAANEREKDVA